MNKATLLITYDIHVHAHSPSAMTRYVETALALHDRLGAPASFLFPAEAAEQMAPVVRRLLAEGHAVGNHGLTHQGGEVYDTLPPAQQAAMLREATARLEDVVRAPVRFFRAPAFRINAATLQALDALDYEADLSMNSGRLGLLSSDPWNTTWLRAPRLPYHPNAVAPWRRGGLRLWEIPLSCRLLPFMSNTLLMFGRSFMQAFFEALRAEACRTGKPIVYMAHPEELHADRPALPRYRLRWQDFLPLRYGFGFRQALMATDPVRIAAQSAALLAHMTQASGLRALTVPQYVRQLAAGQGAPPAAQLAGVEA